MPRTSFTKRRLAGIQYVGLSGISAECKDAVIRLLQCGVRLMKARILSHGNVHCLLLTAEPGDLIAVKSGFASGYAGEGPHTLSFVLQVLYSRGVDIEEYKVSEGLIDRLDASALTRIDLSRLDKASPIQPQRWSDYLFKQDWQQMEDGTLWRRFPTLMPYAIVDARIMDLALKFERESDHCLMQGYRRLEDQIRERTGVEEHGVKLLSKVFHGSPPQLTWKNVDQSEQQGRATLFTGVFMAYRNPRAHRQPS
jgi:hypothetical protein